METIICEEIRLDRDLTAYGWENLPLLHTLKTAYLNTPTEVCIERARWITQSMKESETSGEAMIIRRAKAVNRYLSSRRPLFLDTGRLAGNSTSKRVGAPVYPELMGISIWPELETIGERAVNPQRLSKEDAAVLNEEVFPYWMDRTVLETTRRETGLPAISLMEKLAFFIDGKTTVISHTTPHYETVLREGLDAMINRARQLESGVPTDDTPQNRARREFYRAAQIAMQGICAYAANLAREARARAQQEADPAARSNLLAMADVCERVPAKPAAGFREAVNSLWLCHVGILAENVNMAMNPGRLDQILYPYFREDYLAGRLSLEEALTLVGCLWFKIADNTNLVPESAEKLFGGAGSVPAVTLGGVTAAGADAVNDLTYILLRVTELLNIKDPNVNARYHHEVNSREYLERVVRVVMNTHAVPAFYNDAANIETLCAQGVALEHARDYAVVGCVELASAGREFASTSSILLNLAAPLEMTLFNGKRPAITEETQIGPQTGDPTAFQTFADFRRAFQTQLGWLVEQAISVNEALGMRHQRLLPSPLLSCFFIGPMEKGCDLLYGGALYNSSGATHIAFADTCDSLNAMEYAVFTSKRITMAQLLAAVRSDFRDGGAHILPYVRFQCPKYGTDHPIAVNNSRELIRSLFELYQGHTNYRGGKYRPAYWTMTNHAGLGKVNGALPNGRRHGEVFASGITPVSQAAPQLTTALRAVAGLDHLHIPGGVALNIKYTPPPEESGGNGWLVKFADLIHGYFLDGGMQVQFNVQTYQTLIEAKHDPARYPELLVRVSGYSAYFKDLNEAMKDELIVRTQYNVFSGRMECPCPRLLDIAEEKRS